MKIWRKTIYSDSISFRNSSFWLIALAVVATISAFPSSAFAAVSPDADRTFLHPAENGNGSSADKYLTLTPNTYTFRTDAEPDSHHVVDWYTTFSGGSPVESEHFYYYDDHDFTFSAGNYWVRAEVYASNLVGTKGAWEAVYRWYVTIEQPKPDLIAYGISASDTSVDPDQSIEISWTAKNDGDASCGSSYQGVMWSTDTSITTSDTELAHELLGSMNAQQTNLETNWITVPTNANPGQTYYIGIIADYDNDVTNESSETNNNDGTPVAVTINLPPETISPPTGILGNQATYINISNSYTASGASSNLGHTLQYKFYWGDGTYSDWGSATQSHCWDTADDYYIDAQARCANHTDKESDWGSISWHVTVLNPPQITVSSPNGGESWEAGTTETITWNSTETVGEYVRIELYKDDSYFGYIVSSTENDGVYSWSIPLDLPEGTTYQVMIIDTADSSTTDYSNGYFYITASAIPEPDLVSVSGIPSSIEIGQNFTVTITSQNNGLITPEGAIHAAVQHSSGSSFVNVDELLDVNWATGTKHYSPDEENTVIYNKDQTSPRGYPPADWFLQAWQNDWDNNVQHSMSFQVRPLSPGTITILVRTTMQTDSGIWVNDISADTSNPIQYDEQGWQCRLYTVNVEPPEYGVTIITHGWSPEGGGFPLWPLTMASEITQRAGIGSTVFEYDPLYGDWVHAGLNSNTPDPSREIVLDFDWFEESDRFGEGYSEAAGDALFAALKSPKFVDSTGNEIAGFENVNILEKELHFIGHSRGTVVNSMATRRIAKYTSTNVNHVTTLDPHPAGGDYNDPDVYTWTTIDWADNYWRSDGALSGDIDGRPVDGAWNNELNENVLMDGGYDTVAIPLEGGEHSDVHLWYHGTIDPSLNAYDGSEYIPNTWYDTTVYPLMGPRTTMGYFFSRLGGGAYARLADNPGSKVDPSTYPIDYIFNGDFELRGPGTDKFPGWHYHGGQIESGTGNIDNHHLSLNANDNWLTHNRLYVPENATGILFDLRIPNRSNDGDSFRISFDDGDTESNWVYIGLESTSEWVYWQCSIPLEDRGKVGTIRVDIVGQGGDVDSSVDVDNLDFAIDTEPSILSVIPGNTNVSSSSGTTSFSVSNMGGGTMPWTAQVIAGASWLSITSGYSGTDSGIIQTSFTENSSPSSRIGTIRVTAAGASGSPVDITVTQAGAGGGEQFNLTTNVQGQGDITLNPSGGIYDSDTTVQITANPDSGWYFDHWEGALSGSENPETILMDGNKTVTAVFEQDVIVQYALTTSIIGGNGSISPASRTYTEGTVVPLVATPDPGYRVKAWVGTDNDPSVGSNTNSVTMDSDRDVTVEFEIIPAPDPDIYFDGIVNFIDFSILASRWQDAGCGELGNWCDGADVDYSGAVNFEDLSILCSHWLEETQIISNEWVTISDAGNTADDTTYGSVDYIYQLGKYEVTNVQYCEFLNAVAADDTYNLYNTEMYDSLCGGIVRNGFAGNYTYSVKVDKAQWPVNFVSFYDCLRFCNWLHNGQPYGTQDDTTTEDGSYDMNGDPNLPRKPDATVWLPSEDEWYKAAYYKGGGKDAGYWDYATQSDTVPTDEVPPGSDFVNGSANYNSVIGTPTDVGAYVFKPSVSAYETFDQAGNVWEWVEDLFGEGAQYPENRVLRGGSWYHSDAYLPASYRSGQHTEPIDEDASFGFRIASSL